MVESSRLLETLKAAYALARAESYHDYETLTALDHAISEEIARLWAQENSV
jgi:hypothetical protein